MENDRVPCCVPGCARTMGVDVAVRVFSHVPSEWICRAHWSRLSRAERAVWRRTKKRADFVTADRVWRAIKRRAAL